MLKLRYYKYKLSQKIVFSNYIFITKNNSKYTIKTKYKNKT